MARRPIDTVALGVVGVGIGLYGRNMLKWLGEHLEGVVGTSGSGGSGGFEGVTLASLWHAFAFYVCCGLVIIFAIYCVGVIFVLRYERQEAFEEAKALVDGGNYQKGGVAITREKWGLAFFGAKPSGSNTLGLIYYPGALVDETAYALLCAKIASELGANVAVVRVPLRIATLFPRTCARRAREAKLTLNDANDTTKWIYGGHSLGGSAAARALARDDKSAGLLLHASFCENAPFPEQVKVLQIVAEHDTIIPASQALDTDKYAGRVVVKQIDGANHAGFGHYGPQRFPRRDGERTIKLDDQIDQVVNATAEWARALLVHPQEEQPGDKKSD